MGQQQLLLILLVTIIVGIATVVAVQIFSTGAQQANLDAVHTDLRSMANFAQAYYQKPSHIKGGGQSYSNITFEGFAIPGEVSNDEHTEFTNENGKYTIIDRENNLLTIRGESSYEENPIVEITTEDGAGHDDFAVTEVDE